MTNITELSLTKLVSGIKKKDFSSEEVTKSFVENSKKSKRSWINIKPRFKNFQEIKIFIEVYVFTLTLQSAFPYSLILELNLFQSCR